MRGGRNSLGLVAGALLIVSLFLPWYELYGSVEGKDVAWKVYPFWQEYDATTKELVFPSWWRRSNPPTSSFLILQPIAAVITIVSALTKTWTRRALGLTVATALMMVCIGDFVQNWVRMVTFSGLPSPPGEMSYDSSYLKSQWGIGIFISGIGLVFLTLSAWLEVWRILIMIGKRAVESVAKRPID